MNLATLIRLAKSALKLARDNPAIVAGAVAVGRKVVKGRKAGTPRG